jgi:putative ABC transport system permease protein
MRNVTFKGLLAHKLRLLLTALAIILGVTFISGTFILTDTLHNTFTSLFSSVYSKIDFQVRGVAQFGNDTSNAIRDPISESLLAKVRSVPGVEGAAGSVQGYAQFIAPDGKAVENGGSPTLGMNYDPDKRVPVLNIVQGGPPVTASDVVVDAATAQKYGFRVGQRVRILFVGPSRTFTISGIVQFGTASDLAGATLAGFSLPTAQAVLDETGELNYINAIADPGADKATVQRDIAKVLPPGVEVVTGQTVADENTDAIDQSLSFFNDALLVFAFISLFVGAFTIYNTFSIVVGQRNRELALLRAVGASRRQVFGSVLAEAAIVGFISSAVGIGIGVLTALALKALISGFGITLPSGPLVFGSRTVIVGLLVGTGVTVVSAIGPARHAVRIPPVAALTDRPGDGGQPAGAASLRRLAIWGAGLAVVGVAMLAAGLTKSAFQLVGLGAICLFIGVAVLAPAAARPLSGAIGSPLARLLGEPGKLGQENSVRNPRRTAQTASALMVGLALVSAMAVFGASLSDMITSGFDQASNANLILTSTGKQSGFSSLVPTVAAKAKGVTVETTVYRGQFQVQGSLQVLTGVATQHLSDTVILNMTSGSPAALDNGELLIDSTTATSKHLSAGDTVPVKFAKTGTTTLRIGGVYRVNALVGSYLVSSGLFLAKFQHPAPATVLLRTTGSETAVQNALSGYPNVQVQTRDQYEQSQASSVNGLLGLVYALLALAVIIALIGIVNTLMLSVIERTHEIGLLRAVGMRRRQVRSMIRSEAVILSIFGAVLGVIIGTPMGLALVASLRKDGFTVTSVPYSTLAIFLIVAAVLGLIAAAWPARRAAKLDVLAAIATE